MFQNIPSTLENCIPFYNKKNGNIQIKTFKNFISFYSQTPFCTIFFQHPPFTKYTITYRTTWRVFQNIPSTLENCIPFYNKKNGNIQIKTFKNFISFYSQTPFCTIFFSTSPFHELYHKIPYNMESVSEHSIHIIKFYMSIFFVDVKYSVMSITTVE